MTQIILTIYTKNGIIFDNIINIMVIIMKHAVRITKIIIITVIAALLLPLTAFLANLAANNFVLAVYNHKIGKIKLPDNTEVVNSGKMVGNFFGNGDSLDFLVYYNYFY